MPFSTQYVARTRREITRRHTATVALTTSLLALAPAGLSSALAEQAANSPLAQQSAMQFDIPAGSLNEALAQFARTTGLYLSGDAALTDGKRSRGLKGQFTINQALAQLLKDSGIDYSINGSNTITLQTRDNAGVQTLRPMLVTGGDEHALGAVEGYIATRSATGTKTDALLIETPQSVSVITADQIRMQSAETPSQALRYTPGVVAELYGNDPRFDWVRVRGFSVNEYLDGMALPKGNYAWPRLEMYGLTRAEVLRGPASVLYGSTPPGGLYNFVSKRPENDASGEVNLQVADPQRVQGSFDLTGPAGEDSTLSYRLTGLVRDGDTFVDHVEYDRTYLQPSFTWQPTDRTALTVTAYTIEDDSKSAQFLPHAGVLTSNPNGTIPRESFLGEPDYDKFERSQAGIGYHLSHAFDNGWKLNHKVRYAEADILLKGVRPSFGYVDANLDGQPDDYRTHNRAVFLFDETSDALTMDTNLLMPFETRALSHQLLAGVDYRRATNDYKAGYSFGTPIDVFNPVYGTAPVTDPAALVSTDQTLKQTGVYLQDQIKYDRLTAIISARRDWTDIETENRLAASTQTLDDSKSSYRGGLIYNFDNGFAPFVAYSTSFTPNTAVDANGQGFDPTTGKQLEAGVKYLSPDQRTQITLSAYELTQSDALLANPVTGIQEQVGEITVQGVELEARLEVQQGFNLIAAYSWTDAEFTEHNNASVLGNQVHTIPEHQASFWADYQLPASTLKGLGVGGGIRYVGKHYGDAANSLAIPSYTITDAALYYDLNSWLDGARLSLNVSNLFDREYVAHCDTTSCYWGEGRTVRGTFNYRW